MEALYAAVWDGDIDAVGRLVDHDRLDEPANSMGWTILMTAAARGQREVVDWLLEVGARPDIETDGADTALSLAAGRGYADVVKSLIADRRVDVNCRDGQGWTPIQLASLQGDEEVVAVLLDRNDLLVNMADIDGRTALIWAASAGHESIARRLAADPRVAIAHAAADGVTAAQAAREAGLQEFGNELEKLESEERPSLLPSDFDSPPLAAASPGDPRPIREPKHAFPDR